MPAFSSGVEIAEARMALPVEDPKLRREALVYVIRLYDELTEENGAPTLGTQNRAVDFILADPELCRAVEAWAHPPRAAEGLGSIAAEGDPVIRLWAGHLRIENLPSPSGRRGDQGFLIPVKLHTSGP